MSRAEDIAGFLEQMQLADARQEPLAGDASFRRYIRIRKDERNLMLMDAPPAREDVRPFLAIAQYLYRMGFSVPNVLGSDAELGFVLLEDLGDATFTRLLKESGEGEEDFYAAAIDVLAQWHGGALAEKETLPLPLYDEALLMREVQLFSDWYLPQIVGIEKASALAAEYLALWREIFAASELMTNQFVHRDYHADNLMWLPERAEERRVGILDFQDGVYGDAAYDMVSLLEDARRDVSPALASRMIERYLAATGAQRERFMAAYALLGAQRNSKIIGIFTRLGARDGKAHYINYLPRVWAHLERDLAHPQLAALKAWLDKNVTQGRGVITIAHDAKALGL